MTVVNQRRKNEGSTDTDSKVTVAPVNGPMLHLELSKWVDGPTTFEAMDGWLQSQIDAGKLVQC